MTRQARRRRSDANLVRHVRPPMRAADRPPGKTLVSRQTQSSPLADAHAPGSKRPTSVAKLFTTRVHVSLGGEGGTILRRSWPITSFSDHLFFSLEHCVVHVLAGIVLLTLYISCIDTTHCYWFRPMA
jgi:hypothetical protein